MRVKCVTALVPDALRGTVSVGPQLESRRGFGVVPDTSYLVFGLEVRQGIPWVEVEVAPEELLSVPLAMFDIVDPTIPDAWEARVTAEGDLLLWPAALFSPDFPLLLYEGDPVARAAMSRLRGQLGDDPPE